MATAQTPTAQASQQVEALDEYQEAFLWAQVPEYVDLTNEDDNA